MHRRHHSLPEADPSADDFDDRRDAIRRAARTGYNIGRALWQVRAMHHGLHLSAVRWRRQEDSTRPGKDVFLQILAPRQRARALEHELDAEFLPRQLQWIPASQGSKLAACDDQIAGLDGYGLRIPSVDGVETEQVCKVVGLSQFVDRGDFERGLIERELEDRPPDSA